MHEAVRAPYAPPTHITPPRTLRRAQGLLSTPMSLWAMLPIIALHFHASDVVQ